MICPTDPRHGEMVDLAPYAEYALPYCYDCKCKRWLAESQRKLDAIKERIKEAEARATELGVGGSAWHGLNHTRRLGNTPRH